jgi:hypothetical protein
MRRCIAVLGLVVELLSHQCFASPSARSDSSFIQSALPIPPESSMVSRVADASESTAVSASRLAIIGGTVVAGVTTVHIYQSNGWWKNNRAPFHFQEDLNYGLWVDKVGHFYGAAALTFMFSKAFQWANLSERSSLWWGAGGAIAFQTYIEIEDGFSKWGFDRVDFASDVAGALYPVAQHYSPFLQNFNFKFSYHPSALLNNPGGIGFKGQKHIFFDDYEGQTLWLSIRVNGLLPKSVEPLWPDWLCIAVGYGARDIANPAPYPVVILSFDYDMTKIIPDDSEFLKTLGQALNFIHLPAPAVRISPHAIWYGLYF